MRDHSRRAGRLVTAQRLERKARKAKSKAARRAYLTLARTQRRRAGRY